MKDAVFKNGKLLKKGITTGSCAAAAAKAAAIAILGLKPVQQSTIQTKDKTTLTLNIIDLSFNDKNASCGVVKDAGDDPDVTDGLIIYATVEKIPRGIEISGGEGVGTVTKEGLPVAVGQSAINPVPREMITQALSEAAEKFGYQGGFNVTISVPGGQEAAKKTFNPTLGIVGGISILGTSGIVEPMSDEALLHTIYLQIDQQVISGSDLIILCPGNYGLDFLWNNYHIPSDRAVKCSNYIGKTLDYCVFKGVKYILLVGHSGKLSKLAGGIMDTHSKTADCRGEIFAAHAALCSGSPKQVKELMEAATTSSMDSLLFDWGMQKPVWDSILSKIIFHLKRRTGGQCQTEVIVFTNEKGRVVMTNGAEKLLLQCGEEKA